MRGKLKNIKLTAQSGLGYYYHFADIGDAHPFLEDAVRLHPLDFFKQRQVIFIRYIYPETGFERQPDDAGIGIVKIFLDIVFNTFFLILRKIIEITTGKINPVHAFVIGLYIAQKIYFLKSRPKAPGRRFQVFKLCLVAIAKHIQAHEAHYFGATVNIGFVPPAIVLFFLQVEFHAVKKGFNQRRINFVPVYRKLKTVEDGVEADAPSDGPVGFGLKLGKQHIFFKVVE